MNKSPLPFLNHILEEVDNIEKFTKGLTKEQFISNKLKQYAVIRSLEIIGEAARTVSGELRQRHPEVPWESISGTRNRLAHGYIDVDLDIIWTIVTKDLPPLIRQLTGILQEEQG